MSLVDKLMAIDKGEFATGKTAKLYAKHLSDVLGETTEVTVKALTGEEYSSFAAMLYGDDGEVNYSKIYEINTLLVAEGMVEPDLKDSEMQKHFGVATPKELAKLLFPGGEISKIADKITEISGFGKNEKEEIKNL